MPTWRRVARRSSVSTSSTEHPPVTARDLNRLDAAGFAAILAGPREHAIPWVAAAADLGVVDAQAVYGQWLLDGDGVPRDAASALAWFKRAAQTGHAMSMNMVGRCYENGWGVSPQADVAAYWFRLAAEAGLDWGMYNYATSLALGRGVAEDKAAAFALLQRARALGHIKSINLIGGFYEEGWVVAQDAQAALTCYAQAAAGGDFRGQFNYARGLIALGDVSGALAWLTRVPETATAAFMIKLLAYLEASPHDAVRTLGQSLIRPRSQA